MTSVTHHRLGRVEYADGLELQNQFIAARKLGAIDDTLFTLEHPAVLTMGRGAKAFNILAPKAELEARGVAVFETDRGGDVTYHGPGQLVGYPLLYLAPGRQDVRQYVRNLEETIIRALADFDIAASRLEKWPGVWVNPSRQGGPRKICALGVHLSRWYTRHGFALNVSPNLAHFELIVPCGIFEAGVTSMAAELQREVAMHEVEARIAHHFGEVFEARVEPASAPERTVAVAVIDAQARVLLLERTAARGAFWQIVTGHVEQGESPLEAARRELLEETGLGLEPLALDYTHALTRGGPRITQETGFAAKVSEGAQVRLSPEHLEAQWVSAAVALERLPFEGLREIVRRSLLR